MRGWGSEIGDASFGTKVNGVLSVPYLGESALGENTTSVVSKMLRRTREMQLMAMRGLAMTTRVMAALDRGFLHQGQTTTW
jgi:hypothetical protein